MVELKMCATDLRCPANTTMVKKESVCNQGRIKRTSEGQVAGGQDLVGTSLRSVLHRHHHLQYKVESKR